MLLGWRHGGFNTHRGNRIARDDRGGREALCQYILRNAFSVEKMTYVAESGTVVKVSDYDAPRLTYKAWQQLIHKATTWGRSQVS